MVLTGAIAVFVLYWYFFGGLPPGRGRSTANLSKGISKRDDPGVGSTLNSVWGPFGEHLSRGDEVVGRVRLRLEDMEPQHKFIYNLVHYGLTNQAYAVKLFRSELGIRTKEAMEAASKENIGVVDYLNLFYNPKP